MSVETCRVCGGPIRVMAHRGTGLCSQRCAKAEQRAAPPPPEMEGPPCPVCEGPFPWMWIKDETGALIDCRHDVTLTIPAWRGLTPRPLEMP